MPDLGESCLPRKPNLLNPSAQPVPALVAHASDVLPVTILAGAQSGSDPSESPNTPPATDGSSDHNLYKDSLHEKRKRLSPDPPPVSTGPAPDNNNTSTDSIPKRCKRLSTDAPPVSTVPASDNTSTDSISKRYKYLSPVLSTTIDSLSHDDPYKYSPYTASVTTNGESDNNSSLCRKYKLVVEVTPGKVSQRGGVIKIGKFLHRGKLFHHEKWKNEGVIGSGASGSVFLQRKKGTRDVRAVKRLMKDNWKPEWELINLIRVIDFPEHFVQFHGWYENHDFVFYVMEYLKHGDLGKYIEKNPEQVVKDAREISRQILEGLEVLHERHICHRDLKPQNVLIASLSPIRIKLADFGISKYEVDSAMKTTGVGTMGYTAPEVLRFMDGKSSRWYTSAVDMWSFGCLVHVMLTSQQPFTEEGHFRISILSKFCEGQTELAGTILFTHVKDPYASEFVQRLLIKDGSQRMSASEALGHEWITNASLVNATCDRQYQFEPSSAADTTSSIPEA